MKQPGDLIVVVGVDRHEHTRIALDRLTEVFAGPQWPLAILLHIIEHDVVAEASVSSLAGEGVGLPVSAVALTPEEIEELKRRDLGRMEPLVEYLAGRGWPKDRIECRVRLGGSSKSVIADELSEEAREAKADIVVVGRTRHGKLWEAFLKSTGERLVHYCPGLTVWVVGHAPTGDGGGAAE